MYNKGDFCNYLLRFKVDKGCEFTHTSIIKPTGAFYISSEEEDIFFRNYINAKRHGEELYLTEKHKHVGPIIIDFDFRFEVEPMRRRYTRDTIEGIVKIYVDVIGKYFEKKDYAVYVMEKPGPVIDKGLMKDGLHIMIPDLVSRPSVQFLIREEIVKRLAETGSPLDGMVLKNTFENIVDEAVISKNNWQMYGSRKPNCEAYKVTQIYKCENGEVTGAFDLDDDKMLDDSFVELLSIRNKYEESGLKEDCKGKIEEFEKALKAKQRKMDPRLNKVNTKKNTHDNLELVNKLVDILSPTRANSYDDWIRVGWCLRNIDHRLMDQWINFSKKSTKFVEGECEKYWNLMKDDGLGIGTLHMWAKQDNMEEYKKIMERDLANLIYRSSSETHYDIARVVHFMFKYEYVCVSIKGNSWFEFRDHRWIDCDSGHSLRSRISTDVVREYSAAAAYYNNKAATEEMEADQQRYLEVAKKLNSVALKLKQCPFKDNIIKECRELFYVEKFEEKLDSRCHLIGFENGVYDMETDEFREGRPEDYISFTTGNNYVEFEPEHPRMKEVFGFLSKVFTKEEVKTYVLKVMASFLNGNIKEERFNIWTGIGCFAKDTPILMYDGSSKGVQDVKEGDLLMGDDSTPRKVLNLKRGYSDMYEIIPIKGEKFVVNGMHDLVVTAANMVKTSSKGIKKVIQWVEYTGSIPALKGRKVTVKGEEFKDKLKEIMNDEKTVKIGDIMHISVHDYLLLPKTFQTQLRMYRPTHVKFEGKEVKMDPYMLGYWLGNGNKYQPAFTTQDQEVVDEFERVYGDTCKLSIYEDKGIAKTYGVSKKYPNGKDDNEFSLALDYYDLYTNKHIPDDFKINSVEVRQRLLAGIIDSDGSLHGHSNNIEITLELENLIDDVMFIARSLGIACYKKKIQKKCYNNGKVGTYYRTILHGDNIMKIPSLLLRKIVTKPRKSKVDPLVFNFNVERIENGNFYGFELDGNRRFMLGNGDFTIVKNSNGKSKIIELFEMAFGDYCCKFPITLLTQKRAASNATTSELARSKGKRFACLQEPSEDEKLNIGLMKELTGGDKIQARALFKEPIEFKPQFKMILTCNHLPNVPSDDGGTWRRIRVVEFTSKFKESPDPTNPLEFKADTELSIKFVDWKEHFMALLIQYYKDYKENGLFEPEDVLKCTKEYQRNNDNYLEFMEQEIEKNERGFLSSGDAYNKYGYWLKDNVPHIKPGTKKAFTAAMEKLLGKAVSYHRVSGWKGYKFKEEGGADESDPLG